VLGVMCLALMMVVSAVASLNVALPDLARETRATQTELQWIVDAYALVFACLLLPAGALGDRYGRKGILLIGLVVFGATSLVSIFVDEPSTLIGLRAVMGVGAALVMPTTLSIVTSVFPAEERGHAVGIWAAVAGAGAIIGLLLSGVLLEWFSWSAVFGINVTLAALALVATIPIVPTSRGSRESRLDPVGALLSAAGLFALVFAIIQAPQDGWLDPATLAGFGLGTLLLAAFVIYELNRREPMLDPRLFARRGFGVGLDVADAAVLRPVRPVVRGSSVPAVRAWLLATSGGTVDVADGAHADGDLASRAEARAAVGCPCGRRDRTRADGSGLPRLRDARNRLRVLAFRARGADYRDRHCPRHRPCHHSDRLVVAR
jgi:MFS family permease